MHRVVALSHRCGPAALPIHRDAAKGRATFDARAAQIGRVIKHLSFRSHHHQVAVLQAHRHKLDAQRMSRIHRRTAEIVQITDQFLRIAFQLRVHLSKLLEINDRQQRRRSSRQGHDRQQG